MAAAEEKPPSWHCLRCGHPVHNVLWATDLQRHIHAAHGPPSPAGMPSCCGGEVVPPEEAGTRRYRPGEVTTCLPSWGSLSLHLVRLGRKADVNKGSWRGTALCGRVYRARYWAPLQSGVAPMDLCAACRDAALKAGEAAGQAA